MYPMECITVYVKMQYLWMLGDLYSVWPLLIVGCPVVCWAANYLQVVLSTAILHVGLYTPDAIFMYMYNSQTYHTSTICEATVGHNRRQIDQQLIGFQYYTYIIIIIYMCTGS